MFRSSRPVYQGIKLSTILKKKNHSSHTATLMIFFLFSLRLENMLDN